MKPEYFMASTPHDFSYRRGEDGGNAKAAAKAEEGHLVRGMGKGAPGWSPRIGCVGSSVLTAPLLPSSRPGHLQGASLLEEVLLPLAEELNLPLALKLGAHRGVNPDLQTGGVSAFVIGIRGGGGKEGEGVGLTRFCDHGHTLPFYHGVTGWCGDGGCG